MLLDFDSSNALSLIQKDSIEHHPFASIIKRIHELLRWDWVVQISHIFQEANRAMDFLANIGHSVQLEVCFYDSVPNGLASLLRDDIVGCPFLVLFFSLFLMLFWC